VNSTREHISEWFKKAELEVSPQNINPALFFNMDETMLDTSPKKIRVIFPREGSPKRINNNESEVIHITLVMCIAADGEHLKSSVILPMKEFPLSCIDLKSKKIGQVNLLAG
jgi:hypothetical protein